MELNAGQGVETTGNTGAAQPKLAFHQKFGILLLVLFCFEIGLFLVLFPWMGRWDASWFAGLSPKFHAVWVSNWFRGALSGLGLVDIYISFIEIARLRRY